MRVTESGIDIEIHKVESKAFQPIDFIEESFEKEIDLIFKFSLKESS